MIRYFLLALIVCLSACSSGDGSKRDNAQGAEGNGTSTGAAITNFQYTDQQLGRCKDAGPVVHFGYFGEGDTSLSYYVCPSSNGVKLRTCFGVLRTQGRADNAKEESFTRVINTLCQAPFDRASDEELKEWVGVDPSVVKPNTDGETEPGRLYNEGEVRCVGFSYHKNGRTCRSEQVCGTRETLETRLKGLTASCS